MNRSVDCIPLELLRNFAEDDLTPTRCREWESHLSECPHCRALLDDLDNDPAWLDEVRSALIFEQETTPPLPAELTDDYEGTIGARGPSLGLLALLGPTDDPQMLGRIGPYEIKGILGQGGMGVVFKGFDAALNRFVAIKMLLPHLAASGAARKRFAREAKAAAAVVNDHVMAIHAVSEWQDMPYLVMPYCRGVSLQKRLIDRGPLELKEILRIGMQAAAGLAAAHSQGLVHRDVKPANIMLADGIERVTLTDFGLARAVDDVNLTRVGTLAGTPPYMSPEQARGQAVDPRSDLFSLGSVLYAMCTGRAPFRADSSYGILRLVSDTEPVAIRQINPDLPEWLGSIVARLMAKRPEDRPATAGEIATLLQACLAHLEQPATTPLPACLSVAPPVSKAGFQRFFGKGVMIMVASVGLLLAGILGYQLTAPPDISGAWSSPDWGQVDLSQTAPGTFSGTFSDTLGKGPGKIQLKWSRIEQRFNGTWREGEDDRFGEISLHLVYDAERTYAPDGRGRPDMASPGMANSGGAIQGSASQGELRGALTTDLKSKINPGTPRLADFAWVRGRKSEPGMASGMQPSQPGRAGTAGAVAGMAPPGMRPGGMLPAMMPGSMPGVGMPGPGMPGTGMSGPGMRGSGVPGGPGMSAGGAPPGGMSMGSGGATPGMPGTEGLGYGAPMGRAAPRHILDGTWTGGEWGTVKLLTRLDASGKLSIQGQYRNLESGRKGEIMLAAMSEKPNAFSGTWKEPTGKTGEMMLQCSAEGMSIRGSWIRHGDHAPQAGKDFGDLSWERSHSTPANETKERNRSTPGNETKERGDFRKDFPGVPANPGPSDDRQDRKRADKQDRPTPRPNAQPKVLDPNSQPGQPPTAANPKDPNAALRNDRSTENSLDPQGRLRGTRPGAANDSGGTPPSRRESERTRPSDERKMHDETKGGSGPVPPPKAKPEPGPVEKLRNSNRLEDNFDPDDGRSDSSAPDPSPRPSDQRRNESDPRGRRSTDRTGDPRTGESDSIPGKPNQPTGDQTAPAQSGHESAKDGNSRRPIGDPATGLGGSANRLSPQPARPVAAQANSPEGVWELQYLPGTASEAKEPRDYYVFAGGWHARFRGIEPVWAARYHLQNEFAQARIHFPENGMRGIYEVKGEGLRLSLAPEKEALPTKFGTERPEFMRVHGEMEQKVLKAMGAYAAQKELKTTQGKVDHVTQLDHPAMAKQGGPGTSGR